MDLDVFSREVLECQTHPEKTNAFIQKNNDLIKKCAYKAVGRFVSESDDADIDAPFNPDFNPDENMPDDLNNPKGFQKENK